MVDLKFREFGFEEFLQCYIPDITVIQFYNPRKWKVVDSTDFTITEINKPWYDSSTHVIDFGENGIAVYSSYNNVKALLVYDDLFELLNELIDLDEKNLYHVIISYLLNKQ